MYITVEGSKTNYWITNTTLVPIKEHRKLLLSAIGSEERETEMKSLNRETKKRLKETRTNKMKEHPDNNRTIQ